MKTLFPVILAASCLLVVGACTTNTIISVFQPNRTDPLLSADAQAAALVIAMTGAVGMKKLRIID